MSLTDSLKTTFYASIGLAVKGKEKITEAAKEFAEKNKLNAEEGEKFIKEASIHFEEKTKELEGFVKTTVEKVVSEMGLISRKEYEELKKEYEELKKQVEK